METLQTLTILLSGGGPYGFRLVEGRNDKNLLSVDKVRKRGKADECGLQEGDHLVSVNGRSCQGLDVPSAMALVDSAGKNLTMQVLRGAHSSLVMPSSTTVSSGGLTISAPAGVDLQQNDDKSFTMTIGMPFVFDTSSGRNDVSVKGGPEQRLPVAAPSSLSGTNSSQQGGAGNAGKFVPKEIPQRTIVPLKQPTEKVLSDVRGRDTPETPDTPGATAKSKKVFVDSAFYNDPEKRYPTVDEQISLARQVAMSVLSPANSKSRGHKMFMKRRIRAVKWTTGATEDEIAAGNDQNEDEAMLSSSQSAGADFTHTTTGGSVGGLPSSVVFASRLPTSGDKDRMDAMSMDELDRMQSAQKKTTHTNVAPQLSFNLAADLKNMKGKGGKLFAKRQAKSETWGAEEADAIAADINAAIADEKAHVEQLEKISAQHRPVSTQEGSGGSGAVPVNRLKSMIELPLPAITPWDAAAEDHGVVDRAFEHLDKDGGGQRSRRPLNKGLTDSLTQALGAPRRTPVGRSGNDGAKSLSSVDSGQVRGGDGVTGDEAPIFASKGKFQPMNFKPEASSGLGPTGVPHTSNSSQVTPSVLQT